MNCIGNRSYRSYRSYRIYRSYRSSVRCVKPLRGRWPPPPPPEHRKYLPACGENTAHKCFCQDGHHRPEILRQLRAIRAAPTLADASSDAIRIAFVSLSGRAVRVGWLRYKSRGSYYVVYTIRVVGCYVLQVFSCVRLFAECCVFVT